MASQVTLGLLGLLAFMGASNLRLDLGTKGEDLLKSPIARKVIVFAIAFIYTRNIVVALIVTILYVFVISVFLYEQDEPTAELVEDNNRILQEIQNELQGVTFDAPKNGYHPFQQSIHDVSF